MVEYEEAELRGEPAEIDLLLTSCNTHILDVVGEPEYSPVSLTVCMLINLKH